MKRVTYDNLGDVKLSNIEALFLVEYAKDCNARRAALAVGLAADTGYLMRDRENIQEAYAHIVMQRVQSSHIDAEWVLWELVDNHTIAKQSGNISASNTALKTIASLAVVDAFAAEKVMMTSDRDVIDRLNRGRTRMNDSKEMVQF